MNPILEVKNLNVRFSLPDREVLAVRDLSFKLNRGETLGLVGESGCGKSVTAYSILNLIYPPGIIDSGSISYKNKDINKQSKDDMRRIRGKEIAIIFQEPMTSLNPVFKIGYQISETIKLHLGKEKEDVKSLTFDLLGKVGFPDPEKRYNSYPHELSGGMRQRVMIAMALSANPSILIADEPTTALDVTIQAQILDLLLNLQKDNNMSLLLISHDLGIIANTTDSIAVMYAGEIVEYGSVNQIFNNPLHPYTIGLFNAIPEIGNKKDKLSTIPGAVPSITREPDECVFFLRCNRRDENCLKKAVPLIDKGDSHQVRCIK